MKYELLDADVLFRTHLLDMESEILMSPFCPSHDEWWTETGDARRTSIPQPFILGPAPSSLSKRLDCLWHAMVGDQLAGLLGLKQIDEKTYVVACFRIDPEWQQTSIVRGLFEAMYSFCRERRCRTLLVASGTMPGWILSVLIAFWARNGQRPRKENDGRWVFPMRRSTQKSN